MGLFRRAKAKKRPEEGNYGDFLLLDRPEIRRADSDSIGEPLSPRDQFDLEVPVKRPVGILRKKSAEWTNGRKCIELQHSGRGGMDMSSHDIDQVSTASALTDISLDGYSTKHSRGPRSHVSSKKSAHVKSKWGGSRCCGATVETDDTNANSLAAGRHPIKSKSKATKNSLWECICQSTEATEMVNDEEATNPLRTKKPTSRTKNLMAPKPLRRGTSLFDTLEDEELEDYEEAQTTIAVVEVDSMEEEKSVVTTAWKLRLKKVRSIPKLGLHKVRSIPKLRSFKLGKKKKVKDKEDRDVNDYICR
jgi:hypothetical protein